MIPRGTRRPFSRGAVAPLLLVATASALSIRRDTSDTSDDSSDPLSFIPECAQSQCSDAMGGLDEVRQTVSSACDEGEDEKEDMLRQFYTCAWEGCQWESAEYDFADAVEQICSNTQIVTTATASPTKSASATASATDAGSTTDAAAPTVTVIEKDDSGMSGGAIAGIVLGGVSILVILTAAIIFFCFHRRNKKTQDRSVAFEPDAGAVETVERKPSGASSNQLGGRPKYLSVRSLGPQPTFPPTDPLPWIEGNEGQADSRTRLLPEPVDIEAANGDIADADLDKSPGLTASPVSPPGTTLSHPPTHSMSSISRASVGENASYYNDSVPAIPAMAFTPASPHTGAINRSTEDIPPSPVSPISEMSTATFGSVHSRSSSSGSPISPIMQGVLAASYNPSRTSSPEMYRSPQSEYSSSTKRHTCSTPAALRIGTPDSTSSRDDMRRADSDAWRKDVVDAAKRAAARIEAAEAAAEGDEMGADRLALNSKRSSKSSLPGFGAIKKRFSMESYRSDAGASGRSTPKLGGGSKAGDRTSRSSDGRTSGVVLL